MRAIWFILGIAMVLTIGTSGNANASVMTHAATPTYQDYSRIFERSAGQFVAADGSGWLGQWAWIPVSGGNTPGAIARIQWGQSSTWPPNEYEEFSRSADGNWVLLHGFGSFSTGQFLNQVTTFEETAPLISGSCGQMTPLALDPLGRQHYVKWSMGSTGYCLHASGYIDYQGQRILWDHFQLWKPPAVCGTGGMYFCISQTETYMDNNPANGGTIGGPLQLRQHRINYIGGNSSAKGMAFKIQNLSGVPAWSANRTNYWSW